MLQAHQNIPKPPWSEFGGSGCPKPGGAVLLPGALRNLKRVAKELGERMTDEELQEMILGAASASARHVGL